MNPEPEHERAVFISYARSDSAFVSALIDYLRRNPELKLTYDWDLPYGIRFEAEIFDRIRNSSACLAIWTPHAAASQWVHREIDFALRHNVNIIPVVFGFPSLNDLPRRLRNLNGVLLNGFVGADGDTDDQAARELLKLTDNLRGYVARPAAPTAAAQLYGSTLDVGEFLGGVRITHVLNRTAKHVAVYRGKNDLWGETYVVKEFFPSLACFRDLSGRITIMDDDQAKKTWEEEKRIFEQQLACARALDSSPYCPKVVYAIAAPDLNRYLYIEELVSQFNLESFVEKMPCRLDQAWKVASNVADLLAQLHREQTSIHGAVEPRNIMVDLDEDGEINRAVVVDFRNIRKIHAPNQRPKTADGPQVSHYAPPELFEADMPIYSKSDVYGLAATMRFFFTGEPPPDALSRLRHDAMIPLAHLDHALLPKQAAHVIDGGMVLAWQARPNFEDFVHALLEALKPA